VGKWASGQVGKVVGFKLFARVPGGRVSYDETIRQHRRRPGRSGDEEAVVCLFIELVRLRTQRKCTEDEEYS
jgi:hypothetical protein